jgi:hypothetical protein
LSVFAFYFAAGADAQLAAGNARRAEAVSKLTVAPRDLDFSKINLDIAVGPAASQTKHGAG